VHTGCERKEKKRDLHHDLELAVALGALPLRDEVEHVDLREKVEALSAVVKLWEYIKER
jgi:hypothetical protein